MQIRRPIRANQWYQGDPAKLRKYVEGTLAEADTKTRLYKHDYPQPVGQAGVDADQDDIVGLIGPHAGLSYCGTTSGCSYAKLRSFLYRPVAGSTSDAVEGDKVKRIILMGPSHAKYFYGVMFPSSTVYGTPIGDLTVDTASQKEMESICQGQKVPTTWMTQKEDEAEHSLELHTPYIAHLLNGGKDGSGKGKTLSHIQIVPMVIGDMDTKTESRFGACLKPFFAAEDTLFVISSDFCHWGERFNYTHSYDKKGGSPGDKIERMDHAAMELIQQNNTEGWAKYMKETKNTICGRHCISSFMFASTDSKTNHATVNTEFLHYSQSSRCETTADSSVSYATCVMARKK